MLVLSITQLNRARLVHASQSQRDSAHVTALTAAPVDLKMNANHFSVSVSALNP